MTKAAIGGLLGAPLLLLGLGAQAAVLDPTVTFTNINTAAPGGFLGATAVGNTLEIDVGGFIAVADATNADPTDDFDNVFDTISFRIEAPTGYYVKSVSYTEGLKAILTSGGGQGFLYSTGSATVAGTAYSLGFQGFLADTPPTGSFYTLGITPTPLSGQQTTVDVVITNQITAAAFNGALADIRKGVVVGDTLENPVFSVEVAAIPIPAAVWLFGSALIGVSLVGRRRAAA